jgi:hypothetical protein
LDLQRKNIQRKNVFKKYFFDLICLSLTISCPSRDQRKYARFKGAENHSISSIDSNFLTKTSSILAVLDILYREEKLICFFFALLRV